MNSIQAVKKTEVSESALNALSCLNQLSDQHKAVKYPNVPAFGRPKANYSDTTTNGLTACVIAWMDPNESFCARINSTGLYDEKLRRYRPSGATVGVPDLIGCIRETFVGIEVKNGSDKLRPEQREIANQIRASLGYFVEVRSSQQFYDWYEAFTRSPFA